MKSFKFWDNVTGWIVFAIASFVYLSTIESSASFWDCGEFIAASHKLLVGHPPGAPIFMIIGRLFTMMAPSPELVPIMMNSMSAMASAFTILFLFWSITHLAKKLIVKAGNEVSVSERVAIIGAGVVGALAYTFSDTFWFSAVEGEVYALSSLFTALVFWVMLKWENEANEPYGNRWIILLGLLMGLSIGVHLLNLLAIPAIGLIYYFKKYTPTIKGTIIALLVSSGVLLFIMYGIIPGTFSLASVFELMFVNGMGLPFNSGLYFFTLLVAGILAFGIYFTYVKGKTILNTALTFIAVILIGYSSFAIILIRSAANPPMDQNSPDNVFSLLSYLNREQYGDRPLVHGHYYSAPILETKTTNPVRLPVGNRYEVVDERMKYIYDESFNAFFPRMWSQQPDHISAYKAWGNIKGEKVKGKDGKDHIRPTQGENLRFMFKYQLGHMYWRYFMWNFSGRQNEIQGHGSILEGNWITGLNFIDKHLVGDQSKLPDHMKNDKARNVYYMLPLILGLLGITYQLFRKQHSKDDTEGYQSFAVVGMLFVLTGIAIVIYLNQYPYQPRERDYAFAGSFYAFSIWIGLGVLFLWDLLRKFTNATVAASVATIAGLTIPAIMAAENWDDHNRSGRYAARDFAINYLNSCEKDAIIFTNGDNDTFPLWYAQEVEGIRTDIRVCNLSYLQTDWYIDQMRRRAYDSAPLEFTLTSDQTRGGKRNVALINKNVNKGRVVDLKRAIEFIGSDRVESKEQRGYDFFPGTKFSIPVDTTLVLNNGTVRPQDKDRVVNEVIVDLEGIRRQYVGKNSLMILDLLATTEWRRPIYFAVTVPNENYVNLDKYFQVEGLAYRVVPVENSKDDVGGRIATDIMYDNMMNKFRWGGVENPGIFMDQTILRMTYNFRNNFVRLALELLKEGKKEMAQNALLKCKEVLPEENVPFNAFSVIYAEAMYMADLRDDATYVMNRLHERTVQTLEYYTSLQPKFRMQIGQSIEEELGTLQRMYMVADRQGEKEISQKIQSDFEKYYTMHLSSSR
jgi:hypothetical protein